MQSSAIFPLFYIPPVSYLNSLISLQGNVYFEKHEHFPKQTYRNRATILSPNGPLDLIVPVIKGSRLNPGASGGHTVIKDVRISNDDNWQRLHWKSLESCYRSAAYFEFYEDEFQRFYTRKYDFLLDLNTEMLEWLLLKLKKSSHIRFTDEYISAPEGTDFRSILQKKHLPTGFEAKKYFQVFEEKTGFIPNLSIADLLFNQGPQALNYI